MESKVIESRFRSIVLFKKFVFLSVKSAQTSHKNFPEILPASVLGVFS